MVPPAPAARHALLDQVAVDVKGLPYILEPVVHQQTGLIVVVPSISSPDRGHRARRQSLLPRERPRPSVIVDSVGREQVGIIIVRRLVRGAVSELGLITH